VRFLLDRVGGFPEDRRAGEDTVVNTELWRQGFSAYRDRKAAAIHRSPCTTAGSLWRHHRARGRAWARILLDRHGSRRALLTRRFGMLTLYAPRRVRTIRRRVADHGGSLVGRHRHVRALIVFGAVAAWWGLVVGIVRGNPSVGSPTNVSAHGVGNR
jgi:GT2 family glycosyltransferase